MAVSVVLGGPRPVRWSTFTRLRHSPASVIGVGTTTLLATVALLNQTIAPRYVFATSAVDRLQPPSRRHLMGTDQLGRDLFTWVVRGTEASMSVVLSVVVIAAVIGVVVGALSGLRGGIVDDIVMRVVETVQTVPRFFLAILIVGWFGPGRPLTILLGLTSWPFLARVVRAETLSLREREFVDAARTAGAKDMRVLMRHIVPNVLPSAAAVLALTGSRVVLLETGLAFLGLSDANVASWGSLINNAQPYLDSAWWMSVFPGGALAIAVIGMNLLADGLTDVFNPLRSTQSGTPVGAESSLGG